MNITRFQFCGLLLSIVLHVQAIKGNNGIERTPPALVDKSEVDKREEPDPAKIRADVVDRLLDPTEDAIARWRELETTYARFIADDSDFSGFKAFLDSETGEGISSSNILPAEVEAIRKMHRRAIRGIQVTRDREEYFESNIGLLEQWRHLTQIIEFQIPECTDLNNAVLLNAYNMEMVFSDLEIIGRGYSYAFESFLSNVYQEWLTCLLSEIAELQQDPNFSGFKCEAGVATEMKQISFHILLVFDKLEAVGAELDDTLATFKTVLENAENGCYDTGRLLDAINALISVGVFRRENEVALVALNKSYSDAFQRWLDFFTATKRGDANNKADLVALLEKLLDNTKFGTKIW